MNNKLNMSKLSLAPRKGRYLLSDPFLPDSNFKRTVIILCEHNEEGSIGFVLNKQTEYFIDEVIANFPEFPSPVFMGGPVQQDSMHFIHCIPEIADDGAEIAKGVYWGGDFEKLKVLIELKQVEPDQIGFFLGYSGWGAKQLEKEMKVHSWIIAPSKKKFTFNSESDSLWKDVMSQLGSKYKEMTTYPENPSMN